MNRSKIIILLLSLLFAIWPLFLPVFYHKNDLTSAEKSEAMEIYNKRNYRYLPLAIKVEPTDKKLVSGDQSYLFTGYGIFGIPVQKVRIYVQSEKSGYAHTWSFWNSSWWK